MSKRIPLKAYPVTVTATRYELRAAAQLTPTREPAQAELSRAADRHPNDGRAHPVTLTPSAIIMLDEASAALRAELTEDLPLISPEALIVGYLIR